MKDKSILIVDSGAIYLALAQRLAQEYGKVYYWFDWTSSTPESTERTIGTGIEGVERVIDPEPYYDKVDVIYFPHSFYAGTQEWLKRFGYPVYGTGKSATLENDRKLLKIKLGEWKMPIVPYKEYEGIDEMLEGLKTAKGDKWIKISTYRGDIETYHHWDYENTVRRMNRLKQRIGIYDKDIYLCVEDELKGIETGTDTYSVGGMLPEYISAGYEMKNSAYIARMMKRTDLPKGMQEVNNRIAQYMLEHEASGNFSTELRVPKKDEYYLTDITMRMGVPPHECLMSNWINLGEIIYEGSIGNLIEPIYKKEFMAQLMIKTNEIKDDWLKVSFDAKNKEYIHLYDYCIRDGNYWVAYNNKGDEVIGSVVGLGTTQEGAEKQCLEIAKEIKCTGLFYDENAFDNSHKCIEEGEKVGVFIF